jgi:chromosome segregation ATPase
MARANQVVLQRITGAINRTIAEEQARQKAASTDRTGPSSSSTRRSGSVSRHSDSPVRRPRAKKQSQDASKEPTNGDGTVNLDPAVFEAAFILGDSEEPSRANTPNPAAAEQEVKEKAEASSETPNANEATPVQNADKSSEEKRMAAKEGRTDDAMVLPAAELPPEVQSKLRKLEKLEATYPGSLRKSPRSLGSYADFYLSELLRSYRIAHSRATSIEPFEKALRENTPLTSIKDPDALVEYLNQVNLKGDMVMDELKRISAEKDSFKKKYEEAEKELAALKEELVVGHAERPATSDAEEGKPDTKPEAQTPTHSRAPSTAKSPVSQVLGIFSPKQKPQAAEHTVDKEKEASEEFFSFDNEIPQLQAEVAAKTEEVETLKTRMESLTQELSVAKETSSGLVESLEKATRELGESRDKAASQISLQMQLDAKNTEITSLTEQLKKSLAQLKDVELGMEQEKANFASSSKEYESKLSASSSKAKDMDIDLQKLGNAKLALEKQITELNRHIDSLQAAKKDNEVMIADLTKQLESARTTPATGNLEPPSTGSSASSKKKNKKKKKGGAAAAPSESASGEGVSEQAPPSPIDGSSVESLEAEIESLKEAVAQKDNQIERLSKQRKTEEDLRDEIETLQENLISIGQDHVEAKEIIKTLEAEKSALTARITELEKEIQSSITNVTANTKLQSELDGLRQEYDDLKTNLSGLQSDLGAAQQLAQSRYKDLTDMREVLQKAQPELKSLRQDSAALKTTKEELATKSSDLRSLEKKEKDLKSELTRAQRLASDRETEIRSLREKLAAEAANKLRLEDAQRVSGRDLRRSEAEKIELSAKQEKAARELLQVQEELVKLRPRVKELEDEVQRLKKEKAVLQEEAELKTQQYANAQGLLGSMRDQTAELSVQLKEARSQAESLDEELAEVQKLLSERTREGETMRRLLADVDERADTKVRDMRARMEAAMEERDRIEDESSTVARRKVRETEELKQKIRDLEREIKSLTNEKDDLEQRERDWKRRRDELEGVEGKAEAEATELRSAISNLRTALDASELQVRDAEKQKSDLRRLLDQANQRYDKLSKDHKSIQAKLGSNINSGRNSMDSTRSAANGAGTSAAAGAGSTDVTYLKTILLQFLQQKDNKLRAQLVPVLGKLLRFDK